MTLPKPHSCSWSDDQERKGRGVTAHEPAQGGPESLKDKELYLWVTYPEARRKKNGKGQVPSQGPQALGGGDHRGARQVEAFAYEVTLRRIFKQGNASSRYGSATILVTSPRRLRYSLSLAGVSAA